jgi:hypothetical protein
MYDLGINNHDASGFWCYVKMSTDKLPTVKTFIYKLLP